MFIWSNCDWKSQPSGILTEPLNPCATPPDFYFCPRIPEWGWGEGLTCLASAWNDFTFDWNIGPSLDRHSSAERSGRSISLWRTRSLPQAATQQFSDLSVKGRGKLILSKNKISCSFSPQSGVGEDLKGRPILLCFRFDLSFK